MANSAGLLFTIKGDASSAVSALNRVQREVKDLTPNLGGLEKALGGLVSPAALVGAAVAGIGAAAVAGGLALFNLAKNTAEYGSAIFDATQKTGLGAETMSALKVAAEQSGSSFEGVTTAVAKFNVLIGQAAAGSVKAEKILKTYGITATDTQGALEQTITKIAGMANASDQAAAATALFKDRTGAILPVIRSFDGDLPGLIDKLRDLGLIMSDEDAKAADEFGDQMDTLNAQLATVGRTIGQEVMPVFLKMAQDVSAWLSENKGAVKAWAESTSYWVQVVTGGLREMKLAWDQVRDFGTRNNYDNGGYEGYLKRQAARDTEQQQIFNQRKGLGIQGGGGASGQADDYADRFKPIGTGAPADLDAQEKARKEAEEAAEKLRKAREAARKRELSAQSDQNRKLLDLEHESFSDQQKALEDQFIKREITEKEYREQSEANFEAYAVRIKQLLADAFAVDKIDKTSTEIENLELTRQGGEGALGREVARERADMEKNITAVTKKESAERKKTIKDETDNIIDQAKAKTDTLIQQFELMKAKGIITEKEYAEVVGRLKLAQLELERSLTDDAQQRALIDEEIKQQEGANAVERIEQIEKETKAYDDYREALWNAQMAQAELNAKWREMTEITFPLGQSLQAMTDILEGAFQGMANAIGNVIEQYVLYGKTAPAIMRKVLASALASIAAEAAVQAIKELAYGFMALAFHDYEAAAWHFGSAALFGSIAGVAALAGRAVAGNAFNQQTSQATGQTGSNTQGSRASAGAYSGQEPETREMGINRAQPSEVHIKLGLDSDGVIQVLSQDVKNNGRFRFLVLDTVGNA